MREWGEHLILESYGLSCLIWIQLIVLFLLILLLYSLGLFTLDFTSNSSSATALPSLAPILSLCGEQDIRNFLQVGGNRRTEADNAGVRRRDVVAQDGGGGAISSMKDTRRFYHPCHYFELAKQAFLQCLGLGSPSTIIRGARRTEAPDSRESHGTDE